MHLLFIKDHKITMAQCVLTECPSGFKRRENSCYRVFPEKYTWLDASVKCRNVGAELAVSDSAAENKWLWQFAVSKGRINYLGKCVPAQMQINCYIVNLSLVIPLQTKFSRGI